MKRCVLITGTNRGIGLALTEKLLANGALVHATARNPDDCAPLQALAARFADQLTLHTLDLADEQAIYALAGKLEPQPIDWLISNAGVYGPTETRFGHIDSNAWLQTLQINTIAPMHLIQAFINHLAAGQEKKIGVLSSKVGSMGDNFSGGGYIYRSSKAAVNAVIKSASIDLAPTGINVAALHPGWVRTDMGGPNGEISPAESAAGLFETMAQLSEADRGRFIDIDGTTIPW